jgi:hypothetical protein
MKPPASTQRAAVTSHPVTMGVLLAIVAGYVDATTFLALSGLFVAQRPRLKRESQSF